MIKRKWKDAGGSPGINLTPILGIVFLVLLFFVASVPFARERGVDVSAPWDGVVCQCDCFDGVVTITVDSRNKIFIEDGDGQKQIDRRRVRDVVARRLAEFPKCGVLIQAHRRSDAGIVIRVADEAKKARVSPPVSVSVATVDG